MKKVVPLFKSFRIIFYLIFLEFGKGTFGSNQFKYFLKYLNKSRRVLFSLGPTHFPSFLTGPRSPSTAHALDSLLPCSLAASTVARLCRSLVLLIARPPSLEQARTGSVPSLLAAHRAWAQAPSTPLFSLYLDAKKPPSVVTFLLPSSVLGSSHHSLRTTFATSPCH
jgi:hypothetical protein